MTTWIKVYNSMPSHPKFVTVGANGGWMFICGLCYANEHLTDGFIPDGSLHVVVPGMRNSCSVAARLVSAGLWHRVEGGWQIHDYSEHQRSSNEVRDRREKDRQRKASTRSAPGVSAGIPQLVRVESSATPLGIRDLDVDVESRKQKAEKTTTTTNALRADVAEVFAYWQERCAHPDAKLGPERRRKIEARLREGYTVIQIRLGIDGAARAPFVNDAGKRFDDIELICRTGSKLEGFMQRASAAPSRPGRESASDLLRAINGGMAS